VSASTGFLGPCGLLASSAAVPAPGLLPGTGCLSPEVEVVLDVGLEAVEPDGGRPD
jgi:hypothetical protein